MMTSSLLTVCIGWDARTPENLPLTATAAMTYDN